MKAQLSPGLVVVQFIGITPSLTGIVQAQKTACSLARCAAERQATKLNQYIG
jgi:hypothetical protein